MQGHLCSQQDAPGVFRAPDESSPAALGEAGCFLWDVLCLFKPFLRSYYDYNDFVVRLVRIFSIPKTENERLPVLYHSGHLVQWCWGL